jgi:hypothetical protein
MGFKRETRSNENQEVRSESRAASRRSDFPSSVNEYSFTNIGSIKQGRNLSDKVAAQLKGCEEAIKVKVYMPNVSEVVLHKDAVIGIKLGRRAEDKEFVLGQLYLPMGSITPTMKTSEDLVEFLSGFSKIEGFDLIAQIYLPRDISTVSIKNGSTLLITFKTGSKTENYDFVLGTLALANDNNKDL